jgi:ankyrin repeat protein
VHCPALVTASQCNHADPQEEQVAQLAKVVNDSHHETSVLDWLSAHRVHPSTLTSQNPADGSTALLYAIRRCWFRVTKTLLKFQKEFDQQNHNGDTALHWSCFKSREHADMLEVLEHLLEAGANPNIKGDHENTPLHLAATANCPLVLCCLLAMYSM